VQINFFEIKDSRLVNFTVEKKKIIFWVKKSDKNLWNKALVVK
jgi:hypothetical protein